jgi:hypothetical protein
VKLLTATRQTQGTAAFDFEDGIIEGELVEPASVCDRDLNGDEWTEGCGCGRSFRGVTSHKLTTTAVVVDVEIDHEQLTEIVGGVDRSHVVAGVRYPDETTAEDVAAMVAELIDDGERYPVGSVVGIWCYELRSR